MKPYPAYKPSKLGWLGRIPEHWEEKRAKWFFREVDIRSEEGSEELLSVSHLTGVTPRSEKNITMFMAESYEGFKLCFPGDLVINTMWAWMGALGVSAHRGIISSSYSVYRQRAPRYEPRFLDMLCRLPGFVAEYTRRSKGVTASRARMYAEDFFDIPLPCPTLQDQRRITTFLNAKLAEMDGFIQRKQRLIELLREQKTALIHRAVTRGLDAHVKLKPSGIPWLPEIPAHWPVRKLKALSQVQTGVTLGKVYGRQSLVRRPYLRVANVQDGFFDLSDVKEVDVPVGEASACELRRDDVLVTEGGDADKLGRGSVWSEAISGCLHQNHIFAIRCDQSRLRARFLEALLGSPHGRRYFELTAKQTTNLACTNSTTLGRFQVLLPPVLEQDRILAHIEDIQSKVVATHSRIEREIALMQEYRSALIAEAVTGKIDLRS